MQPQLSLSQWLYKLENQQAKEIQLGLRRVKEVAQKENLHLPACKVISLAGTNGKGSTVAALETIYLHAGYKVGSYTSPHLIHFNERIKINGLPISDEDLCCAFACIEEMRGQEYLTYFEMTTLAALWTFKGQNLDILILEVGLGGRLDATNIVDADLSIITTIDYDHQEYLGSTLEAIGREKAGILRPGKPFIYADDKPPSSIIETAKNLGLPYYLYGKDFHIKEQDSFWEWRGLGKYLTPLPLPRIQLKSAAAALMACLLLEKDLPLAVEPFFSAMQEVFLPGRLQLFSQQLDFRQGAREQGEGVYMKYMTEAERTCKAAENSSAKSIHVGKISVLYDVAHNEQSAKLLAQTLKKIGKKGKVHAIFSALKDKNILGLISPLKDSVDLWYPALLNNKRASNADLLLSSFKEAEIFVEICYTDPLVAFQAALSQASDGDLIVVYGSFFTVACLLADKKPIWDKKESL